jgi:hypothetical protein
VTIAAEDRMNRLYLRASKIVMSGAGAAADDGVLLAVSVPSFNVETRSWLMTAAALAIFLLPHM